MFDREEIQALVLGARIVRRFGDPALARASDSILNKVASILPNDLAPLLEDTPLFVPGIVSANESADALGAARGALIERRKLHLRYADATGAGSERTVRPLGIFFWGRTWTLAAWCELRTDVRTFRRDRVTGASALDEKFADEPGRTLKDMLAQYGPEAVRLLDT
jgi:predicted DNA-binding transcriptional regulator YafY